MDEPRSTTPFVTGSQLRKRHTGSNNVVTDITTPASTSNDRSYVKTNDNKSDVTDDTSILLPISTTWQHYVILYIVISVFRIVVTHYTIHSYFDPDEFWQTLEPAYCKVFYSNTTTTTTTGNPYACDGITWEWTVREVQTSVSSIPSSPTGTSQSLYHVLYTTLMQWIQESYIAIGPIRSYLGLLPTILFYWILQLLHYDTAFLIARGPLYLHILLITVPIDLCTYHIVTNTLLYNNQQPQYSNNKNNSNIRGSNNYTNNKVFGGGYCCLFICLSSWFVSYSFVRTFANTYETLFFILALVLVRTELFTNNDTDNNNDTDTIHSKSFKQPQQQQHQISITSQRWRTRLAFILGGCSVAIRITAVASFIPLGILLAINHVVHNNNMQRSQNNKSISYTSQLYYFIQYLFYPCALYGIIGIIIASICDYYYNGFISIPIISNLYFNVVMDYASLYGSHPWYWYYTNGLITISGLLYPILIYSFISDLVQLVQHTLQGKWFINTKSKSKSESTQSYSYPNALYNRFQLWILLLSYIIVVSWNDHKEFRYISPILPLVFILTTSHVQHFFQYIGTTTTTNAIQSRPKRNIYWYILFVIWIAANTIALVFLGLYHQSGPVLVNQKIVELESSTSSNISSKSMIKSIHYLTGACHSTPLQSHLHIARYDDFDNVIGNKKNDPITIHFDTWHLNCHPHCRVEAKRTNGRVKCETDQFDGDPISFMNRSYCLSDSHDGTQSNSTAFHGTSQQCRLPPNYVVTFSKYMTKDMINILLGTPFNLQIIDLFPNHVRGVQIILFGQTYQFGFGWDENDQNAKENNDRTSTSNNNNNLDRMIYKYQTIIPGILNIYWDAVILLARTST